MFGFVASAGWDTIDMIDELFLKGVDETQSFSKTT
jgi:hypothetical protein